ncbi:glucose-inactivated glycerol proton symporter STL1 [Lachancea thermotolerans CBS 6340]|uniref:KLTH0B04510p n=1 Tax=Lachancea thermotolerans (strain ATCC 56472 / CBS 6340 / NRRL Y-8284) TaxID=559295 RepID=C5DCN4_LACTC|nr:KLTH0B04510p [Lachancea thermotolerans CBS 6340]CAR21545.1 KLTH0B04510p [Lachancea thermotolerans CBS 6340]
MPSRLSVNRTSTLGLNGRSLRLAITITSVIGFSLFGYDQGLMSGLITGKEFNSEFPATGGDDRRTKLVQGAVTACYEIGCFFGSLFVMFRGEQIGRKPLVILGACLTIVGTVISTAAFGPHWGLGQFVVGRVCTGVGTGLNTSTIPVWQSEMSKPENRGILVNLEGSMIAVGTMIAYWIDFGLSYVDSSVQWRFPVAMQIFFALLLLAGIWELPDSPRWLMSRGRRDDALHVLAKLDNLPEDDDAIIAEATVIQDAVNRFRHEKRSVKDLFTGGKTQNLQRALVASSTQFFQQFTGCNAAIYYSTVLFQESIGLTGKLPLILGGVFATIYACFTIPSFFLVETLGRRKLFMLGAAGQAISFTITFGCLTKDDTEVAKGAAVGLFLFICFFGMSMLSLPWIYPPEIASMRVRSATNALSTCTNWLCNFAVVMFTPIFIMDTGYGCYLFFAVMNYLYLPVIFFFYPETAGRSLEEIDIIFAKAHVDGTMPWRVAANLPKLSFSEIEDQANALGLYEDDNEKQDLDLDEAADREDAIRQNSGVQGYTLFEKRENGAESGQPDGSSTSQKSD